MTDVEHRVDPIQGEIVHVYDGIEEADNALPKWWLATFYGAIVFGVLYWIAYHELEAMPLPREEYANALLGSSSSGSSASEELLVALRDDPGAVAVGRGHFETYCVVCHGERGEGNIGPNLTDAYWLHGGAPTDIYETVYDGVLEQGMPAWGASLGRDAVQPVAAYVLSIQNTAVSGKEPQGELWAPGASEAADDVEAGPEAPPEPNP